MTPDHSRGKHDRLVRQNTRLALSKWGDRLRATHLPALRACTREFGFAIESGDLLMLESGWYVTHGGLIRLAHRRHCAGIQVRPIAELSQPDLCRWVFQATIYKTSKCKGFTGFGDADPSNVSPLVRGAEMRVAETRAVNRALRKAYGVPLCSVEEVGAAESEDSRRNWKKVPPQPANGGNGRLQPRLRDRLCQLIRQHQLDPILVKSYALEFCGTKTLNEASREHGFYLVRIRRAQHHWARQKPFYAIQFVILEPQEFANSSISARIYCTNKGLWRLSWFLRDFGYDSELIEKEELDESALVKLRGVIKISHTTVNGTQLLNLDGFAPAARWPSFSDSATSQGLAS